MTTKYQYENLLREPVEIWSAVTFYVGATCMTVFPELLMMPPTIGYWGATAFVIQGVRKQRAARKIRQYQKQLTCLASYTISSAKVGTSKKGLWIGRGFAWDERHTQRIFDLEQAEGRRFREYPFTYRLARKCELLFENSRYLQWLFNFTSSQHNWNPVKPVPDVGGRPALHAVGMWEGEENIYIPQEDRVGHTLVLGTTRVGKTRLLEVVVSQDIRRGDVVIVIDPKGDADLLLRMYAECVAANREDVFHIFHLGYPDISDAYNPIGSFMRLTEVATRVAGQMPGEGQSATFREFVWGYVNTIASALVTMGIKPNYELLKQHAETIEPLFDEYMEWYFSRKADQDWEEIVKRDAEELAKEAKDRHEDFKKAFKVPRELYSRKPRTVALYKYYKDHPALQDIVGNQLCSKINYDTAHLNKLTASLQPFLDKMTTGKVAELIVPGVGNRPSFDWNEIIQKGGVVYVGLDALSDPEVAAAVGNSMFSDLTSIAGRLYKTGLGYGLPNQDKAIKRDIYIHADEFNELIGPEFIPMLNKAGGAGIRVMAYTQTLPDIESRVGSIAKAGQVIGNFNTLIELRVIEKTTAELMVSRQREVQVITTDLISGTSDNSDVDSNVAFSSSTTQRQTRQKKMMLDLDDLLSLPKGQAFALINGNKLHKIRMPLPDKNDLKGIPDDIYKIAEDMRSGYQSIKIEQFRFTEYLTPNYYPDLFESITELKKNEMDADVGGGIAATIMVDDVGHDTHGHDAGADYYG